MQFHYAVDLTRPETNLLQVRLTISELEPNCQQLTCFLPAWSPGSYLVRDYVRHIQWLRAYNAEGSPIEAHKTSKAQWQIEWSASLEAIVIEYEVYAHEFNVRGSHVDASHAFLHGPSCFIGVLGADVQQPRLSLQLPENWQHVTTGLTYINHAGRFWQFCAADYDDLLDCPLEIGNQQCFKFEVDGVPHEVAVYGQTLVPASSLIDDIQRIVATELSMMGGAPYARYVFIAHFAPEAYGGLEHSNSTAVQFDGRQLAERKNYLKWLGLISHEFFHTWNIKRIRPRELGPFDYQQENYTTMLWLAEGLTSFVDDVVLIRAGLCTLDEYLEIQRENLERYFQTYGRKVQSLEDSSYDAWIKLYRPEENSPNITISYYLKGLLVFSLLNCLLWKHQQRMDALIQALWQRWQAQPELGMTTEEVLNIVEQLTDADGRTQLQHWLRSTEELEFTKYYADIGIGLVWEPAKTVDLGIKWEVVKNRLTIKTVYREGAAWRSGLNAGDEVLAVDGIRLYADEPLDKIASFFQPEKTYQVLVARLGQISTVTLTTEAIPPKLAKLSSTNPTLTQRVLMGEV